jgi:AraC-like DNA-binding protein
MALLEAELRSDLLRDDLDGSRLASFFRLKGLGDGLMLAMVMRVDCVLAGIAVKKDQALKAKEFGERFLAAAGWRVLAEARGSELRCAASLPGASETGPELEAASAAEIKRTLDRLSADLLSGLSLRVLVGACPSSGGEGSTPFRAAKDALALARPDRPVVLLAAELGADGGPGGEAGRRGGATVERALAYMRGHLAESLSLADVASAVGSAPSHLSRLFGRHGGDTFVHALCRLRIDAAKSLMRTGQYRVKEVCAMVGFNDQAYFSRVFRKYEGSSPADFIAGGD